MHERPAHDKQTIFIFETLGGALETSWYIQAKLCCERGYKNLKVGSSLTNIWKMQLVFKRIFNGVA